MQLRKLIRSLVLFSFLILNLIFLGYLVYQYYLNKSFPSPMYYDNADNFGDFRNVIVNLINDGPPISGDHYPVISYVFFVPGMFFYSHGYLSLFKISVIAQVFGYVLFSILLCIQFYNKIITRSLDGALFTAILLTSFPMLFQIQRGNNVIVAAIFLAVGVIWGYRRIFYSLAVVLKPYLFPMLIVYFIKLDSFKKNIVIFLIFLIVISVEIILRGWDSTFVGAIFKFAALKYGSIRELLALQYSPMFVLDLIKDERFLYFFKINPEPLLNYIILIIKISCWLPLLIFIAFSIVKRHQKYPSIDFALFSLIAFSILVSSKTAGYSVILLFPFAYVLFENYCYERLRYFFLFVLLPIEFIDITLFGSIGVPVDFLNRFDLGEWRYSLFQAIRPILYWVFCLDLLHNFFKVIKLSERSQID